MRRSHRHGLTFGLMVLVLVGGCTAAPTPALPSSSVAAIASSAPSEPAWAKTIRVVPPTERSDGPTTLRPQNADSVWQIGSVEEPGGLWDERYVWTGRSSSQSNAVPVLGVYILNAMDPSVQALDAVYTCPRPIGQLTITAASRSSVSFSSESGTTGTFDLVSQTWTFG